ncbi:MAG TPA: tetratricopeptide repeat protein [Polyangia bacterium]|nr:tetratricopeptide repeat protein [Polyangia bacterium]
MTRHFRPFATLLLGLVAAFASGRSAHAQLTPQQKQEIHQHYDRATRAYDLGKYSEAVDEYQKVYEIDGDPVMLYNIAQAYRLNDQPQEAVHFYRRYLQRAPEARNRDDVERKIAAQEKLIDDKRKAAAAVQPPPAVTPAPPPKPKVEAVEVPPPPPPPPPVVPIPTPPPPPEGPSTTRRIVGWSMIGAGVAADVVAIIEGIRAKNRSDQLSQITESNQGYYNPSIYSEGHTANIVAIACGIAGTAVAVAGAVVLITGGSSSSNSSQTPAETPPADSGSNVSFMPWIGPGLAGGGLGLRF